MARLSAAIFPLLAIILLASTVLCVYIIAVAKGHVDPIWPYISDCAALYPESSIFAQLLDATACLVVWTAYLRNRRIHSVIHDPVAASDGTAAAVTVASAAAAAAAAADAGVWHRRVQLANHIAFICALIAVFGLLMVGNFQEFRRGDVHYVAAVMLAFGGGLYLSTDALITFVLRRRYYYSKRTIVIFRAIVVLFTWITAIISIVGREVSGRQWKAHFTNQSDLQRFHAQLHWKKADPAYPLHVTSTVCEWLAGVMFLCYFGSFVEEFVEFYASVQITVRRSISPSTTASDASNLSGPAATAGIPQTRVPGPHAEAAAAVCEITLAIS